MSKSDAAKFYGFMLSSLAGLSDDLDANEAPNKAKELIHQLSNICWADFEQRFGNADPFEK